MNFKNQRVELNQLDKTHKPHIKKFRLNSLTRALCTILSILVPFSSGCVHSSVPNVSDQIVAPTAIDSPVSVPDFLESGCPTLQYTLTIEPSTFAAGAVPVVEFTTAPSFKVTQNNNVDSFAVAISHWDSVTGVTYAYTAFMVHPHDPTAGDFVTFCTTTSNLGSCTCQSPQTCATVLDFCSALLFLESETQTDQTYLITNPATSEDFDLTPFSMRASQPDYGCPKDAYTLEVKDPITNTFGTKTWLTLDVTTTPIKMTLALSDVNYVAAIDYRLTYNSGDSATFVVNSCTQVTPSYFLDPTLSLDLYTIANQVVYQFESYFSGPSLACDIYFSYDLTGLTSWMSWDPSAPNSQLTVDASSSGVTTQTSFPMTFKVLDLQSSTEIVTEPFTLTIVDCSDPVVAGFAEDPLGAVTDQTGLTASAFVWHILEAADYIYTLDITNHFVHDNTLCGTFFVSVSSDDPDFDSNYGSFVDTTNKITINYNLRASQVSSQDLSISLIATNTYGASYTYSTTVDVTSHLCDIDRNPATIHVCRFYTNVNVNECQFPQNNKIHPSCEPYYMELQPSYAGLSLVNPGVLQYISEAHNSTSGAHQLKSDFGSINAESYAGVFDVERQMGGTKEIFKLAICHFNEPADVYDTPNDADDKFEYDSDAGTQTYEIEFVHFTLTNQAECGTYDYQLIGEPSFVVWQPQNDVSNPHKMTVNIDSGTAEGKYPITFKVISDDQQYVYDHAFEIRVYSCGQLYVLNPSTWITNLATSRESDNFEYDKYSAAEIYEVDNWRWGCTTICGCITFTSSSDIPVANPTNYISTINSQRKITVDMSTYPTSQFETDFTVTVTGTNPNLVTKDMTFTIKVFDCAHQLSPKPQNSVDMIVYKGKTAPYTFTWTQPAGTDFTLCHDLQVDFEIQQGGGTFTPIDPLNLPTWVLSFTQSSGGAPFSYTVNFKIATDAEVGTYVLQNRVVNNKNAMILADNTWKVDFYSATIPQIWNPAKSLPYEFDFIKQQDAVANPLTVSAFYNYNSLNTNVNLDVFFLEYEETATIQYYTFAEDSASFFKSITLDPTKWPHATVFQDNIKLKVIPNWSSPGDPLANNLNWIEELTTDFVIRLYDCNADYLTPAKNFNLLSEPVGTLPADSVLNGEKFMYQIGTGTHQLDVTVPTQTLAAICGPINIAFNAVNPAHASFFSFDQTTLILTIDAQTSSGSVAFTSSIEFTLSNSYVDDTVQIPAEIEFYTCDAPQAINNQAALTVTSRSVLPSNVVSSGNLAWNDFQFADPFCKVNLYSLECEDPNGKTITMDQFAAQNGDVTSWCVNVFTFDTINKFYTIETPVSDSFSGIYTFTISGWNNLSATNIETLVITVTLTPDCSLTTIYLPTNQQYQNTMYDTSTLYMEDHIALSVREDKTFPIDTFSTSASWGCSLTFQFLDSLENAPASWITLNPLIQPLSLQITGTTNAQFTTLHGIQEFKIRATVFGTTVFQDLKIKVIMIPECSASNVALANVQSLSLVNYSVQESQKQVPFSRAVLSTTEDNLACLFSDSDYQFVQVNYPGGGYNPNVFTFTVDQENGNDASLVSISASQNSFVQNYDSSGTVDCDLGQIGTRSCTIQYEIYAASYNGTVGLLASGSVTIQSECLSLPAIYAASGNAGTWTAWNPSSWSIKQAGYALRKPNLTFQLPQANPVLASGLTVFSQCGAMTYSVINPDPEVFTLTYSGNLMTSGAGVLSQTYSSSPSDNSQAVVVQVYSVDHTKITDMATYETDYTFAMTLSLDQWTTESIKFDYYTAAETARIDELTITLRDYCLNVTYSDVTFELEDQTTLFSFNNFVGQLKMVKQVLTEPTKFWLTYPTYKQAFTYEQDGCGGVDLFYETQPAVDDTYENMIYQSDDETIWKNAKGLEYTYRPVKQYQEGSFSFQVLARVAEPPNANSTMITVNMVVLPCRVDSVTQHNSFNYGPYYLFIKDNSTVETFPNNTQEITFLPFSQYPKCNYTVSYTVTALEGNLNPSDFSSEIENQGTGKTIEIAEFYSSLQLIRISSIVELFDKNTFTVFVTASVDVNLLYQDSVSGYSDPVMVQFRKTPEPFVQISKPTLNGLQDTFTVQAGKQATINLGVITDFDGDDVALEWEIMSAPVDYITLATDPSSSAEQNISGDQIAQATDNESDDPENFSGLSLEYEVSPPATEYTREILLRVYLTELLPLSETRNSQQTSYVIRIQVEEVQKLKAFDGKAFEGVTNEDDVVKKVQKQKPVSVKVSEIDAYGKMVISFDEEIGWPEDILTWNSSNKGKNFFSFQYDPSVDTEQRFEEDEIEQDVTWRVEQIEPNKITLDMTFSNSDFISTGLKDEIIVTYNDGFADLFVIIQAEQKERISKVNPQIDEGYRELTQQSKSATAAGISSVIGTNLALSVLYAKVIQYLWGIVNSLQMVVLTVLFETEMPVECSEVLIEIMKFTNLDIIQTDDPLAYIFGEFRETDPFNDKFEKIGYDNSNFFLLAGALTLIALAAFIYIILRFCVKFMFRKCRDNCFTKRLKQETHFRKGMLIFLIESAIEFDLSAIICIFNVEKANFKSFNEGLSTSCAILIIGIYLWLPVYLFKVSKQYFKDVQDGKKDSYYKDLFNELRTENQTRLMYPIIFLTRRFVLVCLILLIPEHLVSQRYSIQMYSHLAFSLAQLGYVAKVKPFDLNLRNVQELINEFAVVLGGYHLIIFSNWTSSAELRRQAGYSLLGIVFVAVLLNFAIVIFVGCRSTKIWLKRRVALKAWKKKQAEEMAFWKKLNLVELRKAKLKRANQENNQDSNHQGSSNQGSQPDSNQDQNSSDDSIQKEYIAAKTRDQNMAEIKKIVEEHERDKRHNIPIKLNMKKQVSPSSSVLTPFKLPQPLLSDKEMLEGFKRTDDALKRGAELLGAKEKPIVIKSLHEKPILETTPYLDGVAKKVAPPQKFVLSDENKNSWLIKHASPLNQGNSINLTSQLNDMSMSQLLLPHQTNVQSRQVANEKSRTMNLANIAKSVVALKPSRNQPNIMYNQTDPLQAPTSQSRSISLDGPAQRQIGATSEMQSFIQADFRSNYHDNFAQKISNIVDPHKRSQSNPEPKEPAALTSQYVPTVATMKLTKMSILEKLQNTPQMKALNRAFAKEIAEKEQKSAAPPNLMNMQVYSDLKRPQNPDSKSRRMQSQTTLGNQFLGNIRLQPPSEGRYNDSGSQGLSSLRSFNPEHNIKLNKQQP